MVINMKKKASKGVFGQICAAATYFIIGIFMGYAFQQMAKNNGESLPITDLKFIIVFLAVFFIQIILHETGHLLFGLLTGYRFVSFRVGLINLIKQNGKFKIKKYSLANTIGQCLLVPPEPVNGKYPYVLYNLGGVIMNIISSVVFLEIYIAIKDKNSFTAIFFISLAIFGFLTALTNGIPMNIGLIANDGKNTLSLGKNAEALKALRIQLIINEKTLNGTRLKDMPEEMFEIPSEEGMQNNIIAATAVFRENRMMDGLNFSEAAEYIDKLLDSDAAILDLYKNLLIADRICCELLSDGDNERIKAYMTKNFNRFMKQMKNLPSVIRTQYAVALLYENDKEKADKILKIFEKTEKTYPYIADIESERDIVNQIKAKSEQKT